MQNIVLISEAYTNGFKIESLDICFLISIISGILVITTKNPIVSVLCLICLFLGISCYLILLGASFIGLSYLLVYVGAVSILFLFILMLINIRISELLSDTSNSIPLAIMLGVSFNYAVYPTLPFSVAISSSYIYDLVSLVSNTYVSHNYNDSWVLGKNEKILGDNGTTSYVTSRSWDGSLIENSHISSIGNIMYTSYSMWLIITSVILLLAMVGAIIITIKQK